MRPAARDPDAGLFALAGRINTRLATGGTWFVSGKKEIVDRVRPGLQRAPAWERDQFFSVCRELNADAPPTQRDAVRPATVDDAPEILELWETVFADIGRWKMLKFERPA